jgi:parallel beta-helix repeat protein
LNNSTVTGNHTGNGNGYGAAISTTATLILTNSTISNNITGTNADGAGIRVDGGTVTATNSIISGNQTSPGGEGGGIDSVHTVTLVNCLITNNASGTAGGIYIDSSSPSTITNSTISGNTTTGAGGGLRYGGSLTLTNVTITNNRSDSDNSGGEQGGGIDRFVGTLTLKNTLVAGNFRGSSPSTTADDIMGTINPTSSFNLIGTGGSGGLTNGVNNNQVGVADPRLGPLAGNGGLTQTHALLVSSPALDAGNNAFVANPPFSGPPFTDQRGAGFARSADGPDADTTDTVDVGAFEAQVSLADIADQTINEDGSLSLPFNVGGAASITSVTATSSNTTLVPNNPANILISGSGSNRTLLIIPVANAFGTSTITVTVNGSNGQTMTDTFLLTVNPVNDAPAFTKGLDQAVNENDGAQTVNNWATNISAGPPDESGQSLTFIVANNSNPALFAVAPAISSSGALTFTPATGVSGVATITIALMDNGGMANGGIDTSATQSFSINVREGGTLAFSSTTYNVAEDAGVKVITINRTFGSAGTATVLFQTSDGTATAADYTSVSQTITFNDGEVSKTVNVAITDDLFKEPDETVNLTLSNAGGSGQLGAQTTALLTIVDDDPVGGYIRFSDANFDTTESSGSTDITVERLGTTTEAVTVNYATADDSGTGTVVPCATVNSIASSRCDFTTALGALRFAAGESSKTFVVLVSQDNYVEGPETLTLTLSNLTGGAALGTPSTATLTIADDATEPATNPIDVADSFVRQHYHDFLNREPDAAGLAFWSNQITECQQPGATCNAEVRRINVSAAFFLSIEFQETGFLVYRMYKAAYGNLLGAPVSLRLNEFLPDTQQIGKDIIVGQTGWEQVLENNKVAFALDFVSRSRFTTAYPTTMTPAQFVDALYLNTGVTPSAAELTSVIGEFWSATNTADLAARGRAVRRVAENSSFTQQEFNRAFVLMQYFGYLRRNPNDAPEPGLNFDGYNFWLNKLNQFGGNFINAEMVKAFIVSGEYRQRFGP